MSLHDAYARITPYELAFRDRSTAEELVAQIDEEAAGRGADPHDPHAFVTMGAVGAFIRGIEGPGAPSGAVHHLGALVYHGVHFTRAGCPLYLLTTAAVRHLVEGSPDGSPEPTTTAGYLQLPQHLFWAESTRATPESVDGLFWTVTDAGVLHSMVVSGMRSDRPGLDVVPLPEAPLAEAETWLTAQVREDGHDFASTLPGSELDALYSFQAAGEVLKLLARFFAYVEGTPAVLQRMDSTGSDEGPAPSTLHFGRVTLDG